MRAHDLESAVWLLEVGIGIDGHDETAFIDCQRDLRLPLGPRPDRYGIEEDRQSPSVRKRGIAERHKDVLENPRPVLSRVADENVVIVHLGRGSLDRIGFFAQDLPAAHAAKASRYGHA